MNSKNVFRADNQQATRDNTWGASETTRETLFVASCKSYLQGALHDGTFNKFNQRFRFCQKGTEWLEVLKRRLKYTGYHSWIYKEGKDRDVYVLETQAEFLDTTFDLLSLSTLEEKKAYIRGFFDAEGGIPKRPKSLFYIQLVQNSESKLLKIKSVLNELGIVQELSIIQVN